VRPIRPSDRGPAVEDIQRRLLTLGYDLGRTGVDGVFLGATLAAVRDFQSAQHLAADGIVGAETWARLVDETFQLGDRMLYLRHPLLHGADVRVLQGALNALGFPAGQVDGIFGPLSERAVREFQGNMGLVADGIVGDETSRVLRGLAHTWRDKDPNSPFPRAMAPARDASVLAEHTVAIVWADERGRALAMRVANLARAACEESRLVDIEHPRPVPADAVLTVVMPGVDLDASGIVDLDAEDSAARFLMTATGAGGATTVAVRGAWAPGDEHDVQRLAVAVLDGICAVIAVL
jgi:hypothetical protein